MIKDIKIKISKNSGMVNMVINLAILFMLLSTVSGINDLKNEIDQIKGHLQKHTQAQTVNATDEEILKKRMLEFLVQKLESQR